MTQGAFSRKPDKVVQECFGYKSWSGSSPCHFLILPWASTAVTVLAGMVPKFAVKFLKPCSLQEAECVLLKLIDGRHYLVRVSVHTKRADLSVFRRTLSYLRMQGRNPDADESQNLRTFKLFWRLYSYSPGQGTFQPVPAMPRHLPRQIRRALETLDLINTAGVEWKTLNAAQKRLRRDMMPLYGTPRPLLRGRVGFKAENHAYGPIFMVQMLEVGYLIYQERYFYPGLIVLIFSVAAISLIVTLRRQRRKVMAMVNECRLTPIIWEGWVRAVSSHRLLPGDVLVLQQGKALCDMVVLQGSCLVMESMLSGEAAQVRKSNYVPEKGVDYDPDKHHTCTVYAGTMVQQVWNPQDSQDEVLVMVVRNGLNTTMGNLVREIISPTKRNVEDDHFIQDVFLLYAFAFCLQCFIHIPYFIKAPVFHHSPRYHARKILDMLMYSAPPGLPTVMVLIGRIANYRLLKEKISLVFPDALAKGACADIVAFDKTGTLTHSAAELHGVLPVHNGGFEPLQKSALRWSNRLKQAVAICNSLNMVNKHTVVGVDMECTMFKAVEARFLDRETVVLPRQADHLSPSLQAKLSVIKSMEFTSQTLRSGVVVWCDDAPKGSALLFLRGAPAVIRDLVQPASVPPDFNQVMDDYSSKSFRLLAMAVGVIPKAAKLNLKQMTQQQIESSAVSMQLLSLVVLANNVRSDSKATISQLQDGGGLRTLMITGDYHHTAVAVARDVGMVKPNGQVVVVDTVHKEVQQHDTPTSETPDLGTSKGPTPLASPRASLKARNADFAHEFFGTALGEDTPRAVGRVSFAATPVPDQASSPRSHPVKEADASSDTAQSGEGGPEAKQGGVAYAEGTIGKNMPFKLPPSPLELGSLDRQPSDTSSSVRPSQIRPVIDKPLPLARSPSKAASDKSLLVKGRLPFECSLSPPQSPTHEPSRLSFEGPAAKRQPVRASSLTRLPSEAVALLVAVSPPESPAGSRDDSSPMQHLPSRQKTVLNLSNRLIQASVAKILTPFRIYTGESIPLHRYSTPECSTRGLVFTAGAGRQHMDPCDAMTAMAEGSMQCAVTGDAFEMMLQMHDVSVLETVMRSAIVFSRMQPHQKGQVMDLLGFRGIHQPHEGNPRHIQGLGNTTIFCGDGINDLAALAAADVGMSVGASEAVIAAALSTSQASVAGVCSFIRAGKGGHAMMISLFKYMVVYQCIVGQINCTAFFLDGSGHSNKQIGVIDAEAMLMALTACLVPPLAYLNRHKPADRLCKTPALVLISTMAVGLQLLDVAYLAFLVSRPWYTGSSSNYQDNPVVTLLWLTGNLQLLAPLISLMVDTSSYCQSPLKSKPMLWVSVLYTLLAYFIILVKNESVWNPLSLFDFSQSFRLEFGCITVGGVVAYLTLIRLTRRILACHEHRRLRPV